MARILATKTEGVTVGIIGKDAEILSHLVEVTFEDALGVPHTVYAHKDGPFRTADEIVAAWADHTLHVEPEPQPEPQVPPPPGGLVTE